MPGSQSPRKQPSQHALEAHHRQVPYVKRAFFGAIVVDGVETPRDLTLDVQDLVASFGEAMDMDPEPSTSQLPSNNNSYADLSQSGANTPHGRKRATTITSGSATPLSPDEPSPFPRKRANTIVNNDGLSDIVNELVTTERSYVRRLRLLKKEYADPLRAFSRNRDTFLIPPYEAKVIFGNIDALVPVNEAFLADLEQMLLPDGQDVGGIGDVALTHFRDRRGFDSYGMYYSKREEAQTMFEREVKKNGGQNPFAAFIERVKYSTWDGRNRIGLRELLMEPVQRIPRYTLLFSQMIKQMPPHDPQRAKLTEARELASDIARADLDEETKRAATMYCLKASIEDFPASLWSNSRKFIDCVDCVDILQTSSSLTPSNDTGTATPGGSGSQGLLHCTLILFDDKLLIVKRTNTEKPSRQLLGLDEIDKVAMKVKSLSGGSKKPGMVYKGVVEVTDVVCTDNGGADMHIYLETPPPDQSGMWAGRPFRQLSVVLPPATLNLDPSRTEDAKGRFLESLWTVQARYRTRSGQSVVLSGEEREVGVGGVSGGREGMGGMGMGGVVGGMGTGGGMGGREGVVTIAKPYYNLYPRTWFSREPKKTKLVVHVDRTGAADPVEFGIKGPFVVVRIQPLDGGLSRFAVSSAFQVDDGEEDIVHTGSVAERVVNIIHQYGLFSFKTGIGSAPVTPSTNRTRAGILGEAIARNLFHSHSRPGSSSASKSSGGPDFFGGSLNAHHTPHKRARMTVASRSSANTTSTGTTGDSHSTSSLSRFARSRSTSMSTAATSAMMELDEEHEHERDGKSVKSFVGAGGSGSSRRSLSRKLIKTRRSKSPMPMVITTMPAPGEEVEPVRSASRASSEWTDADDDDDDDDDDDEGEEEEDGEGEDDGGFDEGETIGAIQRDESDFDLSARLALARKNSQSQTEQLYGSVTPGEETIYEYEDEPPQSLRSSSRASKRLPPIPDEFNASSTSLPLPADEDDRSDSGRLSRPESRTGDRRPRGPRTPSPLPPPMMTRERSGATMEALDTLESTFAELAVSAHGLPTTPLPRSRRQIFDPSTLSRSSSAAGPSSSTHTYSGGSGDAPTTSKVIEPLSVVKRKNSNSVSASPYRVKQYNVGRGTPHGAKPASRKTSRSSLRRTSAQIKAIRAQVGGYSNEDAEKLFEKSEVVKAKIETSKSNVARLRALYEQSKPADRPATPEPERSVSPIKGLRQVLSRAPPTAPVTKEAKARMEEMQRVIQRRGGDAATPRRPLSFHQGDSPSRSPFERLRDDGTAAAMNEVAKQVDMDLAEALSSYESVQTALKATVLRNMELSNSLVKEKSEALTHSRLHQGMREMMDNARAELNTMYDSFNEELDKVFYEVSLPEGEDWEALAQNLHDTKAEKRELERQNKLLQLRLAEEQLHSDTHRQLLKEHGIIY